ncbi:hypothetical protein VE02_02421 [Pseudogymnoascus sp. 03VT05]|nr:hypothetical protein VE02_02421 [Pseudogymnoascus sp. 03VT05]
MLEQQNVAQQTHDRLQDRINFLESRERILQNLVDDHANSEKRTKDTYERRLEVNRRDYERELLELKNKILDLESQIDELAQAAEWPGQFDEQQQGSIV